MKIEVQNQTVPPVYATSMTGNRPGLYVDKVGDIWVTDTRGAFIGFLAISGGIYSFNDGAERKPKDYYVRWLSPQATVALSNEVP